MYEKQVGLMLLLRCFIPAPHFPSGGEERSRVPYWDVDAQARGQQLKSMASSVPRSLASSCKL